MDAVTVEAVLETRAECSDADRARAALSEALVAARAPARGGSRLRGAQQTRGAADAHWTVTMTVAPAAVTAPASRSASPKSVEAVILDDAGRIIAQRTLTDRSARLCVPLARAVGAWASLVLDAELAKAKDDDGPDAAAQSSASARVAAVPSGAGTTLTMSDGRPARDTASPAGDVNVGGAPRRSIELGTMMYLRNGMTSTGGFGGLSPFLTVEVASSWVVRPSLAFGRSSNRIPISATETAMMSHIGARADFCRRIPGNYIERRGVEADLCLGLEGGVVTSDRGEAKRGGEAARIGVGPSANLRGELGAGVALEVRGLFGTNLVNAPLMDEGAAPLVFASAELGVSVRLP